jgi:hypothetical protein
MEKLSRKSQWPLVEDLKSLHSRFSQVYEENEEFMWKTWLSTSPGDRTVFCKTIAAHLFKGVRLVPWSKLASPATASPSAASSKLYQSGIVYEWSCWDTIFWTYSDIDVQRHLPSNTSVVSTAGQEIVQSFCRRYGPKASPATVPTITHPSHLSHFSKVTSILTPTSPGGSSIVLVSTGF